MVSKVSKIVSIGKYKIILLLSALVTLVVADGLMTEFLVGKGAAREANPFLQPIVGQTGFMVLKVVGALLCALILWDVHRRYPKVGIISSWIAVIGYAIIVTWNATLILLA